MFSAELFVDIVYYLDYVLSNHAIVLEWNSFVIQKLCESAFLLQLFRNIKLTVVGKVSTHPVSLPDQLLYAL